MELAVVLLFVLDVKAEEVLLIADVELVLLSMEVVVSLVELDVDVAVFVDVKVVEPDVKLVVVKLSALFLVVST